MTRRLLSACLGAAAFVGVLDLPARTVAKPPDLPMNETITATLQAEPMPAEGLLPTESVYDSLPAAVPTPSLYQLRPTARRTVVGSILLGVHPVLALLPTSKALDAPNDHPQRVAGDDVFSDMPKCQGYFTGGPRSSVYVEEDWFKWLMTRLAMRHPTPTTEQNEGYITTINAASVIAGLTAADAPASEVESPSAPADEALAMPQEDKPAKKKHEKHHRKAERLPMPREEVSSSSTADGVTCPYLRQQYVDRHACQLADPQIGHDVLDNLELLKKADRLLELAEALAQSGHVREALQCCTHAQDLCPGSPCASRAAGVMLDVCFGSDKQPAATEEAAEEAKDDTSKPASKPIPGLEQQVDGLMKACRLLMNEGLHEQAAELACQAFALDPEQVMADPLIYKMHLLAESPAKHATGASEASEPPSCPYCPHPAKPISGILPEKKPESGPTTLLVPPLPPIDYEVVPALDHVLTEKAPAAGAEEASEEDSPSSLGEMIEEMMGPKQMLFGLGVNSDGGLRLIGECPCGSSVYHVQYSRGCLAIWKTADAAKTQP